MTVAAAGKWRRGAALNRDCARTAKRQRVWGAWRGAAGGGGALDERLPDHEQDEHRILDLALVDQHRVDAQPPHDLWREGPGLAGRDAVRNSAAACGAAARDPGAVLHVVIAAVLGSCRARLDGLAQRPRHGREAPRQRPPLGGGRAPPCRCPRSFRPLPRAQ